MANLEGYKVSEILKYIPRVVVSSSGTVLLENKLATVFLNDRQLTSEEAANYIKTMNAKDIAEIAVQSTHGGTNSADIQGGIINIITKIPQAGFSGTLQTYNSLFEQGYYQWSPNVNLFYGGDNWNIYATYSLSDDKNKQYVETTNLYTADTTSHFEKYDYKYHTVKHTYRTGIMYVLNKVHTLGFEFNGTNDVPITQNSEALITLSKQRQQTDEAISATQYMINSDFCNASANYVWKIDTLKSELKLLFNYNNKYEYVSNLLNIEYQINPALNVYEEDIISAMAENYSFKADFRKNWASKLSMLIGGKYLTSNRKSNYTVNQFDNNPVSSTNWKYKENITGGYAGLIFKYAS